MSGSGLFSNEHAVSPAIVPGKSGMAGEIADLRRDLARTLGGLAAITVEEFTNALASASNNMMAATASVASVVTLLPAAVGATGKLTQATIDNLAAAPRQLSFATAGSTPAHQPDTCTVYGKDERGKPQVEVVTLKQTADSVLTANFWSDIEKVVLAAGQGTGATLAIGLGLKIGLSQKVVSRAGRVAVIQEVSGGSVVTTGTVALSSTGTSATVTGSVNLVDGTPVMPTTETLVFAVDGGALKTVTFDTPADLAAIVAAINTVAGATIAAAGGTGDEFLTLTSTTAGVNSSIDIRAASTSLTILGLTAGVTKGLGNGKYGSYTPAAALDGATDFALYYEYDPAA
jgi:hypothetical protein